MCGIIGYTGTPIRTNELIDRLQRLVYRGHDSCGIAVMGGDGIVVDKRVGTPDNLVVEMPEMGAGIGHVRWATHGRVTRENAHPHTSCDGELALVHNGTIDNYLELKEELEGRGHKFLSETDTEVVAHLLEDLELQMVLTRLKGTLALAVIQRGRRGLLAVRRGCPLVVCQTEAGAVWVASDENALPDGWRYYPEDGEVVELVEGMELPKRSVHRKATAGTDKGVYPHFMLKEIHEQPEAIRRAVGIDEGSLTQAAIELLRADQVVFTASGTSRFAALVGRYIISRGTNRLREVIAASEFQYFVDGLGKHSLVVAVSQSGETADVLHGVKLAKEKGAWILAVTNNPRSALERLADRTLCLECGVEIGVAASKTFTGQLAVFYQFYGAIMGTLGEIRGELRELAGAVESVLGDNEAVIEEIAREISGKQDFYYLGRGINFAVAGECAWKMTEITYIHAEGMAAGEMKHGPLALIGEGTPVCGLCPEDYTRGETVLNLLEVKARGGMVIGMSGKRETVFDRWIKLPEVKDIYYPVVCAVAAQMLAYKTAVAKGLNPDLPHNISKTCTVR